MKEGDSNGYLKDDSVRLEYEVLGGMKMKRSMAKKLMACILSVVLTGAFAIPSFAAEDNSAITPETTITEDNIIDVMNYLDLDTDKLVLEPQENGLSSLTVGELQSYIDDAKNETPVCVEIYSETMPATRASEVFSKMYYATFETSTYTVTFETAIEVEQFNAGLHIWEEFIKVTSMDAKIASHAAITISHGITDKDFVGKVIENGARAQVDHNLEITHYVNIAFAKIPYNTANLTGTNYYTAQTIN